MHSRTIIRGQPGLCGRIAKGPGHFHGGPPAVRHASSFFPPSSFHYGPPRGDFFPLIRFMDDFSRDAFRGFENFSHPAALARNSDFPWNIVSRRAEVVNPRFDIKETDTAYELHGELPGVEAKDVEVAFTDAQTLVIKGRTERESQQGNRPEAETNAATPTAEAETQAAEQHEQPANDAASEAGSTFSTSSYQKPSVEDEDSPAQQTPNTTEADAQPESSADAAARAETSANAEIQQQQQPQSHYWVSERSVGSFQRTFSFPQRVNQEAVRASLKNGILELNVPKATKSEAMRINVE